MIGGTIPAAATTHPGAFLYHDFMVPMNMSATDLAGAIHVPVNRISQLVRGMRAVTADTALRLGRYFGTSAEMWLNMQTMHDLSKTKAEFGKEIDKSIKPHEMAATPMPIPATAVVRRRLAREVMPLEEATKLTAGRRESLHVLSAPYPPTRVGRKQTALAKPAPKTAPKPA